MTILESVNTPRDLDRLSPAQLDQLCEETRDFLVQKVSRTGGHLGPNLGVVEVTVALHRVFDSPQDAILFDTGHQSYVHKMLTGRQGGFDELRQAGGLSGYPSRAESEHDWIENSHASTALSYADGLAKAWALSGELGRRRVVAVVGDGSLTGGMAWEALNNIAGSDRQVIIVVNDNARSYAPTVGGVARHLEVLRATDGYERFLDWGKKVLGKTPVVGRPAYETLHGLKKGVKDVIAPQGMFEDLGLKYIGPVDGHNRDDLERALHLAKDFHGPVIVHAITHKGHGYAPAERDDADHFHGVGVIDPETGKAIAASSRTWTSVFADELVSIGEERQDVVAITAAMLAPTGLTKFAERFPSRTFDVGIAEQHAATSAAGLAMGGLHPVVALYATFLNRAYDQVLMDCAMHRLGVTFVLDRAGITGDDGASHNGMWDMSILQTVPGLRLAAPRDVSTLQAALREAVATEHAVTVVRFAKGAVPEDFPVLRSEGGVDILAEADRGGDGAHDRDVLIVPIGSLVGLGLELSDLLAADGIASTVASPVWVKPVPPRIAELAADHRLVVTIEDNGEAGGVGASISQALRAEGVFTPLREYGIEQDFIEQGKRAEVLARIGLTGPDIHRSVVAQLARHAADLG